MLKKTIDSLAHLIAQSQGLDREREAVIAYGMLAFSQMLIILLLALLAGLLMHAVAECLIIYFVVGAFRKFTGGAHGRSMGQCILVSVCSLSAMAAISKYILARFLPVIPSVILFIAAFLVSGIIVYRRAPVDSPNKPIRKPEKIRRLRIGAFIFLSALFVICAGLSVPACRTGNTLIFSIIFSVCLSLLWQSATLTALFRFFR